MKVIDPNASVTDSVFALVYGGSGTGKTHLMGTVGELGETLIIDIDKGYKTIVTAPTISKAMKDNITITTFDKFGDLDTAYKLVEANDPARWSKLLGCEVKIPFKWIVWDTWSEMQWFMMQELRKNEQLLSPNMGRDINFRKNVGIQHWGMLTDLNKLAVQALRDCTKVNQIFTMQEKMEKDDDFGTIIAGPAIHGKMVQEMPAFFDIVVRTSTAPDGSFLATTKRKGAWPAKSRLAVGQDFKNPTAKQLFTV